jgi:hypothetical protein
MPDDMLPPSHTARVLWNILGTLNLAAFGAQSGSTEGKAGRSLKSPRMMLTLWLYAIISPSYSRSEEDGMRESGYAC